MHHSAYIDATDFVNRFLNPDKVTKIADIGSYDVNGCLRPLFQNPNWQYTGFDISDGPNVDVTLKSEYGWGEELKEQFDIVVSTQVMEHVYMPWKWILDVVKLAKPGGIIYVCTPHTIHYHPYPVDCWRAWPDGMKALLEYADVDILECRKNEMDTTGIAKKRPWL